MSSSVIDGAGERDYEIFSNNFWGKEEAGYEVLTSRLRQAKQTCEDVRNMFHERALIEEEYAKRLMRISKIPIGKDESGTLRDALEVCRQELESTAKEHITLSQKIRTELEQEITHFIARQKETRKLQQAIAEKSLRNKKEHAILVQKAKERYESECIKIQGLLAGKNSIMGKDLEKLNLKIEKAQMSAKTADQEYMKLVKDAQDITQKWNYDWRTACDKFQDLEEERVDSLKTFLWTYANLISTVCVADDEVS
ncbi:hypothetical protein C1646_622369 [Rhizophagus diaphanus]|nr:hypothetical protein C1646_622369 [Rhizophagus diaphanus] [Rhizophagus sp. MUCL 43196]